MITAAELRAQGHNMFRTQREEHLLALSCQSIVLPYWAPAHNPEDAIILLSLLAQRGIPLTPIMVHSAQGEGASLIIDCWEGGFVAPPHEGTLNRQRMDYQTLLKASLVEGKGQAFLHFDLRAINANVMVVAEMVLRGGYTVLHLDETGCRISYREEREPASPAMQALLLGPKAGHELVIGLRPGYRGKPHPPTAADAPPDEPPKAAEAA